MRTPAEFAAEKFPPHHEHDRYAGVLQGECAEFTNEYMTRFYAELGRRAEEVAKEQGHKVSGEQLRILLRVLMLEIGLLGDEAPEGEKA